ncbi:MAG TPA: hypothetical protein VHX63_05355 [Acidobacteriaceae bacterium]|nr:hypothetical protein [Acidobacteriaceae bacterium]
MRFCKAGVLVALVCFFCFHSLTAQTPATPAPSSSTAAPSSTQSRAADAQNSNTPVAGSETHITPEQAKELFSSVDTILKFASTDTDYPIEHPVKRRLVTRDEVAQYLLQQLQKDRDTKRLQRSELVLKKFGLLDPDFHLGPFLIQLLREQVAGYYDDKTKTVNLLDWIGPEAQKPVLAHELTHALQDQHVSLDKWGEKSEDSTAKNVAQDNEHLAKDEDDTVRDAVLEGQAMVVFIDYALAPAGKTVLTAPQLVDKMKDAMSDNTDSPVMARAPLLLQQSLIFPYREGLNFIATVLKAKGKDAAFAGTLDHPPTSTYEIMNPRAYLGHAKIPLLTMPDIHGLIDPDYRPYDIGVMGELDVRILTALFSGQQAAEALAPAWRGGIYYAAQNKQARTDAERASTASLSLLYLSCWATPEAARSFAQIYSAEIGRKYDHATLRTPVRPEGHDPVTEQIWDTSEGPVLIAVSGRTVFTSESFPLPLAHKLEFVMMGSIANPTESAIAANVQPHTELSSSLRQYLGSVGERAAVSLAAMQGVEREQTGQLSGVPRR